MSGKFRLVYPSTGRLFFDGGLNNKSERSIIGDNESPDCANVRFYNGAVETRRGTRKFNTAAIGSFVGDFLGVRHDTTGAETMVAAAGGSFWYASGTSFITVASSQSMFSAGVRFGHAEYENKLFVGNGNQIPYKYDGTNFTRHGVYPPTTTMTAATASAGTLTGGYRYKVTAVNSASVESDVSPSTATLTVASNAVTLTSIPTFAASFGISARKLYRTESGGSVFKYLATISDNSTSTYNDNIEDSSLGSTAPTDNGVPPKYNVIRYHQNRLWCNDTTNQNYLFYSNLNDPYTFESTNFIRLGDATSDLVKGIEVFGNNILVLCANSCHLIYLPSSDPTEWVQTKIQTPYGCRSPYGIFNFNKAIMYPAFNYDKFAGFAALEGIGVKPSTTFLTTETAGSLLDSDRIEPSMFEVQQGYAANISSAVFENVAYISVTNGDGNTTNNRVWVYNFALDRLNKNQDSSWSPDTGINAAQFCVFSGNLYYISSTANGYVYQYEVDDTYNDDGSAINSYYWTKEYQVNQKEGTFNDFRFVKMLVDKAGDFDMDLWCRVNSDSEDGDVQRVDLNPGGSLWGSMRWGIDLWGGGSDQEDITVYLGSKRGERIQFKFSNQNTVDQRFKVHSMRFYFNQKGWR